MSGFGLVAERDVIEAMWPARCSSTTGSTRSGISSGSSSSSKTRSADATADCRTFTMLASWVIGRVN